MRAPGRTGLLVGSMLVALALAPHLQPAIAAEDERTARVTYVTGSTVYLDAGREEGLRAGMELVLTRGEERIARLTVKDVSAHRSSCSIADLLLEPETGDEARFVPAAPETAAGAGAGAAGVTAASTEPDGSERRKRRRGAGIHGRVGLRYLVVDDRLSDDSGYSQPALDLLVNGASLGGSAWGFSVDARARRTYRDLAGGEDDDENRSRLYRLAVMRRGVRDGWDLTLGRQFSPAFASVSIFDGVSGGYRGRRWAAGGFSGTQPDPVDSSFDDTVREHGAYFQYHGRGTGRRSWQLTTGLVGSYQESEVNREFFYVQGRYNDRRLAVFFSQQVDFNRDWKADEGQDEVEPTSTFASLRFQVSRIFEVHGGYDNRRNVRLYRDRITPITEFDDAFRRGVWAGASVRVFERFRFGIDGRTNGGGDAGDAETYSFVFGVDRLTRANLRIGARASSYSNEVVEGWLGALDVGTNLGRRVYLQLYGGLRDEENLNLVPADNTLAWYGLDVDVDLGRRVYAVLTAERTDGDFEEIDQYYVNLSYRF